MAANYSILAWRIPWIEDPGGLQSAHKHATQKQKKRSLSCPSEMQVIKVFLCVSKL